MNIRPREIHPLDNPIWSALTTCQAGLAQGGSQARRYPGAFARFAAFADPEAAAFDALMPLMVEREELALFTLVDLMPPASLDVTMRREMVQMWCPTLADLPAADNPLTLGERDLDAMRALVELTRPGPFQARTHELGRFLGVRVGDRLAAMVGERMHLSGYTEVSAVCADPAFRGRGLARGLLVAVCGAIIARGERPILHAFADNLPAITLYKTLGFEVRRSLRLTVLRSTASSPRGDP